MIRLVSFAAATIVAVSLPGESWRVAVVVLCVAFAVVEIVRHRLLTRRESAWRDGPRRSRRVRDRLPPDGAS